MRRLLAGALLLALTSGCAGSSCDELPALQAEREAERAAYLELARSGAPGDVTAEADDRLHALERRVHDLEQRCR